MQYVYEELTKRIIGAAMKVHGVMGNGFPEVIYQRCLAIELEKQGLQFERELEVDVFYNSIKVGSRRVDFLVEDKIVIELKAVIKLEEAHYAQCMNYLEAYRLEVGLLINFGSRSLEFKRFHNNKLLRKQ